MKDEEAASPSFDDLMRVLFAVDWFLDCQECGAAQAVRAAFPEQFAQHEREYAQAWERAHPGRVYHWRGETQP